jgi:hypothetical protein
MEIVGRHGAPRAQASHGLRFRVFTGDRRVVGLRSAPCVDCRSGLSLRCQLAGSPFGVLSLLRYSLLLLLPPLLLLPLRPLLSLRFLLLPLKFLLMLDALLFAALAGLLFPVKLVAAGGKVVVAAPWRVDRRIAWRARLRRGEAGAVVARVSRRAALLGKQIARRQETTSEA